MRPVDQGLVKVVNHQVGGRHPIVVPLLLEDEDGTADA